TLGCTSRCRLDTSACDPTFFVLGGGPAAPECLAVWQVMNAGQRPGGDGKASLLQRCHDGDPGCAGDATPATCTFRVAGCLDRDAAGRSRGGREASGSWTLLRPVSEELGAAVAALVPSSRSGGTVTFAPPLDATERCTAPAAVTVPARAKLVLK